MNDCAVECATVEPAFDSWLGKGIFLFSKSSERLRTLPSVPVNSYIGGFLSEVSGRDLKLATYRPESVLSVLSIRPLPHLFDPQCFIALRSDVPWTFDRAKSKLTEGSDSVGRIVTFVISDCVIIFDKDVKIKVKVKRSRYRPGVAHRVPGSLGSQIT
jgi:hypothetical protein